MLSPPWPRLTGWHPRGILQKHTRPAPTWTGPAPKRGLLDRLVQAFDDVRDRSGPARRRSGPAGRPRLWLDDDFDRAGRPLVVGGLKGSRDVGQREPVGDERL